MRVSAMLALSLLLWSLSALADTTCPALRAIDLQPQPTYVVKCLDGPVEITTAEYHAHKHNNFSPFCRNGPANPAARGEGRWVTASGFPEPCDVFTTDPRTPVRTAAMVYFLHQDLAEQEIDTSVHALVYQGDTLRNFHPPVPGILVGP